MRHVTINIFIATSIVIGMLLLVLGGVWVAMYFPNVLWGFFFLVVMAMMWIAAYLIVAEYRRPSGEKTSAHSANKVSGHQDQAR
ncbi:MAG: hypothetical protein ACXWQ5_00420 [Ktedonobacterales bacterium]